MNVIRKFKILLLNEISTLFAKVETYRYNQFFKNLRQDKRINIHNSFSIHEPFSFMLKEKFGSLVIHENVACRKFCSIVVYDGGKLMIGKNVFINNYCSINCLSNVTIGEHTMLGEGVKIYDHNHKIDRSVNGNVIHRDEFSTSPVYIGNNCWIGSNVTILKGVTIGDNAVVGAGVVVYKPIPANAVVRMNADTLFS